MSQVDDCRIPLLQQEQAFQQMRKTFEVEQERYGKPRNLTRAVGSSLAAWQTTSRALQMYLTLRRIDERTRDILCLYTSLLNRCVYCIDDAAGEALSNGWAADELRSLTRGATNEKFKRAHVAALRYAEALTRDPAQVDEEVFRNLREHFDTEEILEITIVVGMKNFWNRFASALRIPSEGSCQDESLVQELLESSQRLRSI